MDNGQTGGMGMPTPPTGDQTPAGGGMGMPTPPAQPTPPAAPTENGGTEGGMPPAGGGMPTPPAA